MKPVSWTVISLAMGCVSVLHAQEKSYHGDPSGLPRIDMSKKFEAGTTSQFDREFSTRTLDFKPIALPDYSGKLPSLALSQWHTTRGDIYAKTIELRDFETKSLSDAPKPALYEGRDKTLPSTSIGEKDAAVPGKLVEGEDLKGFRTIPPGELRDIINRGGQPAEVHVGRDLKEVKTREPATVKSEKPIPPKSEPGR